MRVLLTISLLLILHFAQAQTSFRGGAGDGYSSATINLAPTPVFDNVNDLGFKVYPTILASGDLLMVEGPWVEFIQLIDASGRSYNLRTHHAGEFLIPVLSRGMYILQISGTDFRHTVKLVITND